MTVVTVRYWGGAQRAAGWPTEQLEAGTLADVRARLAARPGLTAVCAVASFLVDGAQVEDTAQLPAGAVVDVLPPFAGGSGATDRRLVALVSGRVQGVGYRAFAARTGSALGLAGRAENLPDGRVRVTAEGPADRLERLLAELPGPEAPGWVGAVEPTWSAPIGEPTGFRSF